MAEPTTEERMARVEAAQIVIAEALDRLEKAFKELEARFDRG